jgi:MoxR-like ATPase
MLHRYTPKAPQTLPEFSPNPRLNDPALYEPQPELIDAVSVAITLGLPLLLTGEPGTGKTELAKHLAWHYGLGELLRLNVQTSSVASDLYYRYDALAHFQYNQNNPTPLSTAEIEQRFIRYQALGAAIVSQSRRVVLLDEIDKAPRDLPNDVLAALEDLSFYVPEIDRTHRAEAHNRPLIILSSNSEKNLPDAFLRRVAYHHIQFPKPEKLLAILSAKVPGYASEQLDALVEHFSEIRDDPGLKLSKKPATAELIQWAYYLQQAGFDPLALEHSTRNAPAQQVLQASYAVLAKTRDDLDALRKRTR